MSSQRVPHDGYGTGVQCDSLLVDETTNAGQPWGKVQNIQLVYTDYVVMLGEIELVDRSVDGKEFYGVLQSKCN